MGVLLDLEGERAHQMCSFMWVDNFWIMSHSKSNLEQMLRDLMEEAEKWDLAPKRSTHEPEERSDLSMPTPSRDVAEFPLKKHFKILGCAVNRQGMPHRRC